MDDSLRLIQHLYEDDDDPAFVRRLEEDEELQQEYKDLRKVKEALDRRSSPSPESETVDAIVREAADAAAPSPTDRQASDRAARAPGRSRRRVVRGLSTAIAVMVLVGLGWWYLPGGTDALRTADGEATVQTPGPADASGGQAQKAEALPEWDDRDDVVRLHRRIEHLQTRSRSDAWGGDLQSASQTSP